MSDGTDVTGRGPLITIDGVRHGETLVLTVAGELDVATGPRLRAELADALEAPGAVVVLDLTGVTFMGSTGIAVLVDADWQARQRGAQLRVVVDDTRAVVRPLDAAGIRRHLAAYADLDSALHNR
ncbi:MAG TPA: STAS domain-containing protein [Pseudonocardia sp.]|jgi:anti-sigma B factor antagonist|nr:STAS domain-containing protein [Pseudonocardia sp.]